MFESRSTPAEEEERGSTYPKAQRQQVHTAEEHTQAVHLPHALLRTGCFVGRLDLSLLAAVWCIFPRQAVY